MTLVTVPL